MKIDRLATATALSDEALLARIDTLAGDARRVSVDLVAHLAALNARPSLYASRGYGSLFSYCTGVLHLSEDATCNRIEAAKACARFPVLLDLLAEGSMTLTSIRMLGRHLTPENHLEVIERAKGQAKSQIEALVAEIAPRPDARTLVRRLPEPGAPRGESASAAAPAQAPAEAAPAPRPALRASVQITAPKRYRVQFTIGEEGHDRLQRLQALLRREIPDGDAGAIVERALVLLLAQVEKAKLGGPIRSGTDKNHRDTGRRSRHIPQAVRRVVWQRDGGQCAFASAQGQRCTERTFLEFHHVEPHASGGPATVVNISLRCRRHNQYEAEVVFGPRRPGPVEAGVREANVLVSGWIRTPAPGV